MARKNQDEIDVLNIIDKAQRNNNFSLIKRENIEKLIQMFSENGRPLTDKALDTKIKQLNNDITTSFTKLSHTNIRHIVSFALARETQALSDSVWSDSKKRHSSNIEFLQKVQGRCVELYRFPKTQHRKPSQG